MSSKTLIRSTWHPNHESELVFYINYLDFSVYHSLRHSSVNHGFNVSSTTSPTSQGPPNDSELPLELECSHKNYRFQTWYPLSTIDSKVGVGDWTSQDEW